MIFQWPSQACSSQCNGAKVALSSDVIGIQQVVSSARQVDLLALTSSGNLSHMRHFSAYRVSLALLLMLDTGVINLRKYTGYHLTVSVD
jgi:hypothetical protein